MRATAALLPLPRRATAATAVRAAAAVRAASADSRWAIRSRYATPKAPTRPGIALALTSCAVGLAACGGQGSKPNASAGRYGPTNSPVALSRCMRANRVSGFPDPVAAPGGGEGLPLMVNSDGSLVANGETFAGPVLRSAERACKAYLPPAGGPPLKVRAQQRRHELAFARCMRAHGIRTSRPVLLLRRSGRTSGRDRPAIAGVPDRCARVRSRRERRG